jgi:putative phosphoesterase
MRLGVISDVHGNFVALEACLNALEKERVDTVFCLGDIIGYLPLCNEVLDMITKNEVVCIKGNHEAMLLGELPCDRESEKVYGMSLLRNNIEEGHRRRIKKLSAIHELHLHGKKMLFIHGGPKDPLTEYVHEDYDMKAFEDLSYDIVFLGHTHRPFIHKSPHRCVVNVGSCGLPRDYGSLACCAIFDIEPESVSIIRVPFRTKEIVSKCEGRIHPSVLSVFSRKSRFEGRVIE